MNLLEEYTGMRFPRGFGYPYRSNHFNEYFIPNSIDDVKDLINQGKEINCFLSVYAFTQYDQDNRDRSTAILDVIPFDFDDEYSPENSLNDLNKFLAWANKHDVEPRVHYSGNKGFHVYIDINPVSLKYPQETLRKFAFEMQKAAEFTTLDMAVTGDLNRLIRIPNTQHGKTGRYCIPLDPTILPFLDIKDIEYMAKKKSDYVPVRKPSEEITEWLLFYDEEVAEELKLLEEKNAREKINNNSPAFPGLRRSYGCKAADDILASGVKKGSRDYAVCGFIHRFKNKGKSFDETFTTLKEFNEKCDPPFPDRELKAKLKMHWNKDYSMCTFFSQISDKCRDCPTIFYLNN